MTLILELLAASRQEDLLREQRRLRLLAVLARCRRAVSGSLRPATEPSKA